MLNVLQVLEGQLEVLEVEVAELGHQVEQAVQNWRLEELSRPYGRLSSLKQQLQHQAALRYMSSSPCSAGTAVAWFWFLLASALCRRALGP